MEKSSYTLEKYPSGDFPVWSKELGSGPSRVGVREFKSHSPHLHSSHMPR